MMTARSQINHLLRSAILLLVHIFLQVPRELQPKIDRNVVLSGISYLNNGERVQADPWETGPGWSKLEDERSESSSSTKDSTGQFTHTDQLRTCLAEEWAKWVNLYKRYISHKIATETENAINMIASGGIRAGALMAPGGGQKTCTHCLPDTFD